MIKNLYSLGFISQNHFFFFMKKLEIITQLRILVDRMASNTVMYNVTKFLFGLVLNQALYLQIICGPSQSTGYERSVYSKSAYQRSSRTSAYHDQYNI